MKKWGLGGANSFWSVAIAVGFYCLILGISIGSMLDKGICSGSDYGCIEFWINRYQTLLTAFGVIFAVAIAKAQMDANRRQHVAQIKRSFQKELDALSLVNEYLNYFDGKSWDDIVRKASDYDGFLNLPGFNESTIQTIETAINPNFGGHVRAVNFKSQRLENHYIDNFQAEHHQKEYENLTNWLDGLRRNHDETHRRLSQYWS